LYFIFFIALLDFLYLGYIEDIESVSVFILVGILTAFFNKNMIVVLSSSLIITNVLKYTGIEKVLTEGLENESETKEDEGEGKTDDVDDSAESQKKASINIKEDFGQDEQVVYTSTEGTVDEEKMVLAHEKLLEKMNKYKPLLDTLSGLTKNIAIMKQIGHDAKSISDDNTKEYEKETADVKQPTSKKTKNTKKSKEE
jgi:hypothetical protein